MLNTKLLELLLSIFPNTEALGFSYFFPMRKLAEVIRGLKNTPKNVQSKHLLSNSFLNHLITGDVASEKYSSSTQQKVNILLGPRIRL